MISEDDWLTLENVSRGRFGAASRRIFPESSEDLHIAVLQPGLQRAFWFDIDESNWDVSWAPPSLRAVEISLTPSGTAGFVRIEIALLASDLKDVFTALVDDISTAVASASESDSGFATFDTRLQRWHRLLAIQGRSGLTDQERLGLFGELTILYMFLEAGAHPRRAVGAWVGPYNRHQDFYGERSAIEVKTTGTKRPQSIIVESERELDSTGIDDLYLCHVSVDVRDGGNGTTLIELIDAIVDQLDIHPPAVDLFHESVTRAGLIRNDASLYMRTRYTVRDVRVFRVVDGFPRIVESMLPDGVGDTRYKIQISAIDRFETQWEEITQIFWGHR